MRFILLLLFILSGCGGGARHLPWEASGKVKVLTTTAMVGDLVKEVGGEAVDVKVLITGELDPHSYQLVKGDGEKFELADLVFYSGLGLEHGPSLRRLLENSPKAHSLGDAVLKAAPDQIIYVSHQPDPHIWMDYELFSKAVPAIVEALKEKDPEHAELFVSRGGALKERLKRLHQEVREKILSIPKEKRYLVTSHDAFNYFTRAYLAEPEERENGSWRERFNAPEGLAPESQLSLQHIGDVIAYVLKHNVKVLFPESNVSQDSIIKVAAVGKEKGLDLTISDKSLYGDAMESGDHYFDMLKKNSERIYEELLHD